jgi:hypothetical protein
LIAAVTCRYRVHVVVAATIDTPVLRIMVAKLRAAGASIRQHALGRLWVRRIGDHQRGLPS